MIDRTMRQLRAVALDIETREEEGKDPVIEGYFSVFNSPFELWEGATESVAPGAFTNSLSDDVRCLINHDTTLVLGRTKNHTFEIRQDERGLWGRCTINRNDADAMNAYARVARGDVDGCSIGFNIVSEETDFRDDGSIHWTIKEAKLFECSICTFPAYEETNISARAAQRDEILKRRREAWKVRAMQKLKSKGDENAEGIKTQEEN